MLHVPHGTGLGKGQSKAEIATQSPAESLAPIRAAVVMGDEDAILRAAQPRLSLALNTNIQPIQCENRQELWRSSNLAYFLSEQAIHMVRVKDGKQKAV